MNEYLLLERFNSWFLALIFLEFRLSNRPQCHVFLTLTGKKTYQEVSLERFMTL